jgi:Fe-S cluster biogenesis protein NfuA
MGGRGEEREFRKRMERVESLIHQVDRDLDPRAQVLAREIVQGILDLHGAALERILERIAEAGEAGQAMIDSLGRDDVVASVLLLYGLHPLDLQTRVLEALDRVRPQLRSHGGNVELLGIREGVVRLRMQGSCHGCASSAQALKQTIEEAIHEKAPDVTGIEFVETTNGATGETGRARMPLPLVRG